MQQVDLTFPEQESIESSIRVPPNNPFLNKECLVSVVFARLGRLHHIVLHLCLVTNT